MLYEQTTTAVDHSTGWVTVTADTQYPFNKEISYAQVALLVTPKTPEAFRGRFCFDSVNVTRSPRLSLSVDKPSRIYRVGETVNVDCDAIGMATLQNQVELVLRNQDGETIASSVRQLERSEKTDLSSPVLVSTNTSDNSANKKYTSGHTKWTLPELEPVTTRFKRNYNARSNAIHRLSNRLSCCLVIRAISLTASWLGFER